MAGAVSKLTDTWWSSSTSIAVCGVIALVTIYFMANRKSPKKVFPPVDVSMQSEEASATARRSRMYPTKSEKDCIKYWNKDAQTLYHVIYCGAKLSNDGQCMAKINKERSGLEWISYTQFIERVENFASGLRRLGLNPGSDTLIGIYATNSPECAIAEYGIYYNSMVAVPLYDSLGPNACSFCISQAEIPCVVIDTEPRLEALISQSHKLKCMKHIISTQKVLESFKSKAISFGIRITDMEEVERIGKSHRVQPMIPTPESLAVVCYTSGTTGDPKGVMLTHGQIIANIAGVMLHAAEHIPHKDDILISFLPLAHMFERCCEAGLLMVGAKIAYYSGSIKNLPDDIKIIKPTVMPVVPRLLNRIYDKVYSMARGNKLKLWLLNKALECKQKELENHIIRSDGLWDFLVFRKVREQMGGRLRLVVVGAAPISSNVLTFMRCALGCIVCEGYGQTECVCPCTITMPGDSNTGHVGPPLSCCYIKLVDVPEMEFYAKEGKGEVCIRGPIVFNGYFKDPNKTKEVLDDDGWLHTGDIGMWLVNGTLKIIDRKKHLLKLSQGEYVSPEKVEDAYLQSQFVSQVFVHGDSLKSSLVAIVVPDKDAVSQWVKNNNMTEPNLIDLCKNAEVKAAVLADMVQVGKKCGLHGFEQVKDIRLLPEPFSLENGLLTPTLKTKRPQCREYFKKEINEMYQSLD